MNEYNEADIFIHDNLTTDEVAFRKWTGIKLLSLMKQQSELLAEMRLLTENYTKVNNKMNNFTYRIVAVASAFSLAFGFVGNFIGDIMK